MLKAGFARFDVTPPLGNMIGGYFHDRFSDGILDPLQINTVAVGNGEDTVIIAAVDFLGISMDRCNVYLKMMSERTGVPEDHIFISCLHQHTAAFNLNLHADPITHEIDDPEYINFFSRKLCDAAQLAIADMCDTEVSYAEGQPEIQIAFVRRYIMDDGSVRTNPPMAIREHIVRPVDEPDNTVRLVKFKREGKKDIALVNFGTHPDNVGGTKYSADWCGFVRRHFEADVADTNCVFVTGAQGDSNCVDAKNRSHIAKYGDYSTVDAVGRVIANAAIKMWDKTTECKGDDVFAAKDIVYNKTRTVGEERYDELKPYYDKYYYEMTPEEQQKNFEFAGLTIPAIRRIIRVRTAKIYRPVPISVLGFAGITFVGFGGEPFTHYGTAVREIFPDKKILTACCTNGYEGYLPTTGAFSEGGYEEASSEFSANIEEQCVEMAIKLINKF